MDLGSLLQNEIILWIGFNILVLILLAIDLGVFHGDDHEVTVKEGLIWTVVWITLALTFNLVLYYWKGTEVAVEFLTGYTIEKSLSVDNIFVFLMLFSYFRVPAKYQYKVLIYGILGALVLRGIFILGGTYLIATFNWILYVFGAFLVFTGIKMGFGEEKEVEPSKNPMLKILRRFLPITSNYRNGKFFVRESGKLMGTPLLVVLVVVESTDVVFAVDSIPAIFAITLDPFIVYTSNVFAILGLRALYFAMAGLMKLFYYLKYALGVILAFVGVKMLLHDVYHMPNSIALGTIAAIFGISIVLSIYFPPKKEELPEPPEVPEE